MTNPDARTTWARRRRQAGLWVLRSLAATIVLVALYYLLPLDHLASVPLAVILVVGLLILIAIGAWQLRAVLQARYPALRAGEALATTVPLFLLLFALAYFAMERATPGSFTTPLPGPMRCTSRSPRSAPWAMGTSPR
jgi:voltage-gated potassium channel